MATAALAILVLSSLPAIAGDIEQVLQRGPYPHLKGEVLRQATGNMTAGAWSEPAPGDWDGDGDIDLIVGSGYGDLLYFERRADGFLAEPSQMMPDPISLSPDPPARRPVSPALADWDGDGDLDIVLGLAGKVYLVARGPSGVLPPRELMVGAESLGSVVHTLCASSGHLAPCIADMDGDGDLDLLLGAEDGQVWYVANEGTPTAPRLSPPGILAVDGRGLRLAGPVRVAAGQLDADGRPDLVIAAGATGLMVAMSCPRGLQTPRAIPIQGPSGERLGTEFIDAAPALCDWDGAGEGVRVLVGDRRGSVGILRLEANRPATLEGYAQALRAPIDVGRCAVPCAVDWDGDGDLDLVVGGEDGTIQLFTRIRQKPPLFSAGRYLSSSTGLIRSASRPGLAPHLRYAWPCIADVDGDGDPDLLLGQANGRVAVWVNADGFSPGEEIQVAGDTLTLTGATTVSALDYDRDGDTDLFIGTRLIGGSQVRTHLSPEAVLYIENVSSPHPGAPLFVKAVRIDTVLIGAAPGVSDRDGDLLGVSALQPTYWDSDGVVDYLACTRYGSYVFSSSANRRTYPRLELRTSVSGIPAPLVPFMWGCAATRLTGELPGLVGGTRERGWVVWYGREALGMD